MTHSVSSPSADGDSELLNVGGGRWPVDAINERANRSLYAGSDTKLVQWIVSVNGSRDLPSMLHGWQSIRDA
jgi:hypothetical protein